MLVHNLAPPCALSVEVADYLSTLLAYVKEFFLLCYLRVHPVTLGLPLLALSEGTVGHGSVAAILRNTSHLLGISFHLLQSLLPELLQTLLVQAIQPL